MAHEEMAASGPSKLVVKNVSLILSGDLGRPILDADAVVAVDGRISAIGRASDLDFSGATTTIDANGATWHRASSTATSILLPAIGRRVRTSSGGSIPACMAASRR